MMKNLWRVIRFVPEYRSRAIAVILVGTILGSIGTATPYFYKGIVDVISRMLAGHMSQEAAVHTLWLLLGGFALLRLGVVIFSAVQNTQADDLWLETVSTFRQRVFDNMTQKSIDYFERTRVGEIMDRFGTITTITSWLSSLTEGTLAGILQMLLIVAALLLKDLAVGLMMLAVLVLNFAISYHTVRVTRPLRRGWQAVVGRMTGLLAEMVGNIATVRSFGGEVAVKERYDNAQAQWRVFRDRLHKAEWKSSQALNVVNTASVIAVVTLITYGALRRHYTPGDILLVLTLAQNLINSIQPIARLINQAGEIETASERLVELLDVESDLADRPGAVPLERLETVTFEDVSFRYPGKEDYALRHVSFHLASGRTLALVGTSGSGKTTIVKLLMRFYDPTHGRVLVNGRDLREYQHRSVRAVMGVVLQDVALFNDTISENIALARPGASPDVIHEVARVAHADEFIQRLEKKYDTLVGERGIKLSGGEKQRIAIARALLKDPQLVILDEATSALDSQSEHLVQQGLDKLLEGRSVIVIAHRLSTVMRAELILVMRNGEVIERGRHDELTSLAEGLYARLFALQTQEREHLRSRQSA
jgi:ABC-type multidrug transport system fused ATPase/permease subunit